MKLSTRSRYGLRALYELICQPDTPVAIKTIAAKQKISEAYLEQIFSLLKKSGIIRSVRGAQGGYCLLKKPSEISVGEVLTALEGSTNITKCSAHLNCSCAPKSIFNRIQQGIDEVIDSLSLQDMLEGYDPQTDDCIYCV